MFSSQGHPINNNLFPLPTKQEPDLLPKLFGELRERYLNRPGGYTRVLRTEPKDRYDQAPSAILELVDGPKDMRFAMTAAAVARDRALGKSHTDLTRKNIAKVTRYRENGREEFEEMVRKVEEMGLLDQSS
jgi:large subunit ribosomal protein L17